MTGAHAPFEPGIQHTLREVKRTEGRFSFEGVLTEQQMVEVEDLRKALRDLEQAIWAEEARMRREVLPTPPEGWRWASQLSVSDVDQLSGDHMRVRLVFRLVEV